MEEEQEAARNLVALFNDLGGISDNEDDEIARHLVLEDNGLERLEQLEDSDGESGDESVVFNQEEFDERDIDSGEDVNESDEDEEADIFEGVAREPNVNIDLHCCEKECLQAFKSEALIQFVGGFESMRKMDRRIAVQWLVWSAAHNDRIRRSASTQLARGGRPTARLAFDFRFMAQALCKTAFMRLTGVGVKVLEASSRYIKEHNYRPVPLKYKRRSGKLLTPSGKDALQWLRNYARESGYACPFSRSFRKKRRKLDDDQVIYLRSDVTKLDVYYKYKEAWGEVNRETDCMSRSGFLSMWHTRVPLIRVAKRGQGFCDFCNEFRRRGYLPINNADYNFHLERARELRLYLKSLRERCREIPWDSRIRTGGWKSLDSEVLLVFDYAMDVSLPHERREGQQWWWSTPLSLAIFGVVNEVSDKQYNYVIPEGEHPYKTPKNITHVLTMLDNYMRKYCKGEKVLHLSCDNTASQNKNKYLLGFLGWCVANGRYERITLTFPLVGHTKCKADGGFGLIKRKWRRVNGCYTLEDFKNVVESAKNLYNNYERVHREEWIDWRSFIKQIVFAGRSQAHQRVPTF